MKPFVSIVRVGNEQYPTNVSAERAAKLIATGRWELYRKPAVKVSAAPASPAPAAAPQKLQDSNSFTTPTPKKS